jgi:hypothetical protein
LRHFIGIFSGKTLKRLQDKPVYYESKKTKPLQDVMLEAKRELPCEL